MINPTPLLESCPSIPHSLGNMCLFSNGITGGLNPNHPATMATRQGPWTPRRFICERQMTGEFDSYNTPHHDSQMGASSGRICHHNGNGVCMCPVCVLACTLVCEHVSICVVRPWCWLSAERGWVEERRFDKCDAYSCDGSSHERAMRYKRLIIRTEVGYHCLSLSLVHSSLTPYAKPFDKYILEYDSCF